MRQALISAALLCLLLSLPAFGQSGNMSIRDNSDATTASCDEHFTVSIDGEEMYHGEEQQTIPKGSISKLRIDSESNAGIEVQGWDKPDILVKLCKSVAAPNESAAKERLASIKMQIKGGDVTVTGPEGHRWWANFLVYAPKGMAMELHTHNGPLHLNKISGNIDAETVNGPLSIKDCSGKINGETRNGPIHLARTSGDVKIRATNGPLHLELANDTWEGAGLDAEGQNGPVDLTLPASYKSGVEVRSDGHSPFRCSASACESAKKDWDDHSKTVHLGGNPVVVHVSTHNGPVSIRSALF